MGNSHLSNEALPPEQQVVNEYAGADDQLKALIGYLDDSLKSMRERRAYVAPAGRWSLKPYGDKRAMQRSAAGLLVIEKNFYATMGPAKVEQLDEEGGWKPIARPNINCEIAWAFKTQDDARSAQLGSRRDLDYKEKDMVAERRKGAFTKLEIQVVGEGIFELSEDAYDYLKGHVRDLDIWFEQSVQVLLRKREFAEMLLNRPGKQHEPLKQMLEADFEFEPSPHEPLPADRWIELTKPEIMGTDQQREFVEKALRGKDFTIVWGPAGSGKTTAICEFIRQAVRDNKKVLMVGSTHVAVEEAREEWESENGSSREQRQEEHEFDWYRRSCPGAQAVPYLQGLFSELESKGDNVDAGDYAEIGSIDFYDGACPGNDTYVAATAPDYETLAALQRVLSALDWNCRVVIVEPNPKDAVNA